MSNIIIYKDSLAIDIPGYSGIEYTNIDNISNDTKIIYCYDLLDQLTINEQQILLDKIKNKINSSCSIIFQGPDLKMLCDTVSNAKIDCNKTQQILYSRIMIHTIKNIEDILIAMNFTIIKKKYINIFEYYIQCIYEV